MHGSLLLLLDLSLLEGSRLHLTAPSLDVWAIVIHLTSTHARYLKHGPDKQGLSTVLLLPIDTQCVCVKLT
jgi:hypothetical protein